MVSESIIFCENNPLAAPNFSEPMFVRCVWREVVIVNLNPGTRRTKRDGNYMLSKGTIYEKSVGLKRP
jgi:hypothetical protein